MKKPLLPVADALSAILKNLPPLDTERVALDDASGRILAEDLTAKLANPPFSASAMDGYAVRATDIQKAGTKLKVIGEAAAGHEFTDTASAGDAVRIFTGAPLPTGTDTIVIQENTERDEELVTISETAPRGNFVREKGSDFAEGETLLFKGEILHPRLLNLAAAMNHGILPVIRKPKVAIIATGDELILPGNKPTQDQVICSTPFGLEAMIKNAGATPIKMGIAGDSLEALNESLRRSADADIVVTIGGASAGDHDLVQQALKNIGVEMNFWKINMRPGKPLMFGKRDQQRYLGVPGNPVSAMVCAAIFLRPLIKSMLGQNPAQDNQLTGTLAAPLEANGGRQHYMRAQMASSSEGKLTITPAQTQDSAMQRTLARSNCLIVRKPKAPEANPGDEVNIIPIDF